MRAYSTDLRERVIRQWKAGVSEADLVNRFEVSVGSVRRWIKRYEQSGQVGAKKREHWQRLIEPEQEALLRAQVARLPDATLAQHVVEWEKMSGVKVGVTTMWRALKGIGWTLKKRR